MSAFTEEELANMELVRTNIEGMSEHDIDKAVSPLSDDILDLDLGEEPRQGKDQIRDEMQMYFETFPDLKWEITNLFAKGNQVVLEGEGLGTRSENPRDGGPAGSRVQFYFAVVDKVRDGKIYNIKTYICGSELDSDGRVVRTWRGWPV